MGGPPPIPAGVEASQTYCLRWNNHKSNLIEILDALIKVESYVDCTIVVDDKVTFKAHRVVLAANSPYFQAILQDVPMDHCSIIFPGVKAFEMRALLEYMYTGEVNVTQSQIPRIMRIAEELEVKGLFDMADLKEKFNKMAEDVHMPSNPYTEKTQPPYSNFSKAATSSNHCSGAPADGHLNGGKDLQDTPPQSQNSSAIISSSHISPTAAPPGSSSPPYSNYKNSAFPTMPLNDAPITPHSSSTAQTGSSTPSSNERVSTGQWPLSPNSAAAAAAMLSSVYESAPDMNPLKRKKLSSISSMLMNRDTPILRNVLAQANPTDASQVLPLLIPSAAGSSAGNGMPSASGSSSSTRADKNNGDKTNNSFNGSDFSADKQKYPEEPHSPFTDRSFEEDSYDPKSSYTGSFTSNNANQKPEWKRYKQYTRNDIMSAIQCVREGMSALQASRKFGVPSRTLYDKVKKLGITTGRPMNRTMKRSPSGIEATAAFPFSHGYGQSEVLMPSMHETRNGADERDTNKEHHRGNVSTEHGHMPGTLPHQPPSLLDHALLQQALENRGNEALHAMALAAAHMAVSRTSSSPGANGNMCGARSPSPGAYASLKYAASMHNSEQEQQQHMAERDSFEKERRHMEHERRDQMDFEEHERDADDEDDMVEDLSVQRPIAPKTPPRRPDTPHSPVSSSYPLKGSLSGSGVIKSTNSLSEVHSSGTANSHGVENFLHESEMKRELVIDENRAD